jgi:hypothetical protein
MCDGAREYRLARGIIEQTVRAALDADASDIHVQTERVWKTATSTRAISDIRGSLGPAVGSPATCAASWYPLRVEDVLLGLAHQRQSSW